MKTTAPRLATLAQEIKAAFPFATVTMGKAEVSTDGQANRLRIPGNGRTGNKLEVFVDGKRVMSHNAAETYRTNEEVVEWMNVNKCRHAIGLGLCQHGWPFQSFMSKSEEAAFEAKRIELGF